MPPPGFCPNCGAEVPSDARCCPECGADEQTGWSDRAQAQRLGIPDDEFDYDEYVREEFGDEQEKRSPLHPRGIRPIWWGVAMVLLAAFLLWILKVL